jgi:GAF domain-containing protein
MVGRLDPERFAQVVAAHDEQQRGPAGVLCVACVDVIGVAGAGLALMSGGRSLDVIGVSDAATESLEQMEYTLDEGPCVTAYRTQVPVFDADLADGGNRWPEFSRGAAAVGVRAAFGFPLLFDRICIGALNLYHDRPGALTDDQVADALVVAQFASRSVVSWQAGAAPGRIAWQLEQAPIRPVEVYQAAGRISVQSGVSLDDALVLLRAYAFSHDLPIKEVIVDVAAGRLELD